MTAEIVVLGATGCTGERTVREPGARGVQQVLAGRLAQRLGAPSAGLGCPGPTQPRAWRHGHSGSARA